MRIGELAKVSGVAAHTIRFYETKGLLPKPTRGMNGYRTYNEQSVQRLSSIQCAKRLGFSLDDMLIVLADQGVTEGLDHEKIMMQLDTRLEEVEIMMQRLLQQREEIKAFKLRLQENWKQGLCMQAEEMEEINLSASKL